MYAPDRAFDAYRSTRELTETLACPLGPEDQTVQSMPDTSPTKWHRAHTTWFFETFVLERFADEFVPFDPEFRTLFNSYYEGIGPQFTRAQRGVISRPGAAEVGAYRAHVDERIEELLTATSHEHRDLHRLMALGLQHEQQHQELLLMDAKHMLSINPLRPTYRPDQAAPGTGVSSAGPLGWLEVPADVEAGVTADAFTGRVVTIGADETGFCFDNELPEHGVHLAPFRIADRLVTAGEWIEFIDDGGYDRADLWLSDGWHTVQTEGWTGPEYWSNQDDGWMVHTLGGTRPVDPAEPVCHVSHYEADAYANWAGCRLPTEFEWEHAVRTLDVDAGRPFSVDALQPKPAASAGAPRLRQAFGECWQWTSSAYLPYPGFRPADGVVGEYNGKFMSGQMVLRGSSSYTPPGHARSTYRNFFPPAARWMLAGVRLASGGTP